MRGLCRTSRWRISWLGIPRRRRPRRPMRRPARRTTSSRRPFAGSSRTSRPENGRGRRACESWPHEDPRSAQDHKRDRMTKPKELTLRGLVLGALITTVFTAANVYLGLKVGLTFASSIPAAVISMALLSLVRDSSILENNIVQTVASAAGTLSAIIFVLPGLVIVGWWVGFPFWESFLICVSGGVLGG